MDAKLKRKWVEALLSGEYEQGRKYLGHAGKYCCLGVLVKECGGTSKLRGHFLNDADILRFCLDRNSENKFAAINDFGVPFDMIAGLIDTAL